MYIRSGAAVDREHTDILTDSDGNGVVTFTIEAVNTATTGTLTSLQNAQVHIHTITPILNSPATL